MSKNNWQARNILICPWIRLVLEQWLMILFYYSQNEIAMHEVQPSHSRQSKTEYMDLKEVTAFESKRKEEVTLGTP